jgi:asparagine synthase (glutamine-hydrolysing)
MCGITGIYSFNQNAENVLPLVKKAVSQLNKRGPDAKGFYCHNHVALGHARLSIIDITDAAAQPFTDGTGRYTIVFNGEIFNFKDLKQPLVNAGIQFRSQSDTEVILNLFILEGPDSLQKLNGFFAMAIYDNIEGSLFIARDRMGVKPLLYFKDETKFCFASEMKALMEYNIPKSIDNASLYAYLQLNYIPGNDSIFEGVKKLAPGNYLIIKENKTEQHEYYRIPADSGLSDISLNYVDAQKHLAELLDSSVKQRLISDVPLGAFLSGGIDSSVVVALASRHTDKLKTFSIGYRDEPLFDETKYAELVARKFNTEHTVFSLSNDDLFSVLFNVLDYTDEPFADSSALAVYILSQHTRSKVTVALSGDGADELFAGYNKHMAEYRIRNEGLKEKSVIALKPLWNILPKSRNGSFSNTIRQFQRFATMAGLSARERYWFLCSITPESNAASLLKSKFNKEEFVNRKNTIIENIEEKGSLNQVLCADMKMVLANDMLVKVDMMSMANSLEVRTPFLDYRIVDYVSSLPDSYKIDSSGRKKILKDTFRNILPSELYNRPKHGFEVPLLKWMRKELFSLIFDDLLKKEFVEEQGIFNFNEIACLKKQLLSHNPGDAAARIWALVVFQWWWKKYFNN